MTAFANAVLLLTAVLLPLLLFLLLRARSRGGNALAAVVAIGAGWAFNVACIVAMQALAAAAGEAADPALVSVATRFGWVCPTLLVGVAWVVRRLLAQRRQIGA